MTRDSISERIAKTLRYYFEEKGRGTRTRVQETLGLSGGYFRRWETGEIRIDLDRLESALDILKIDSPTFFEKAMAVDSSDGNRSDPCDLVSAIRQRLPRVSRANAQSPTGRPPWFTKLERTRAQNPGVFVGKARSYLAEIPADPKDIGYFCACLGEALRAISSYEEAEEVIEEGLKLAGDSVRLNLDLMQRKAVLFGSRREFDMAYTIAARAVCVAVVNQDYSMVGRVLFNMASWRYYESMFQEAIILLERSGELIESNALDYHCGISIGMGLCKKSLGDLSTAIDHLLRAEGYAKDINHDIACSIAWLRGEIFAELGDYETSANCFEEVLAHYRKNEMYLDAALAAVMLTWVLRESGRAEDASDVARSSVWLIARLKGHPIAEAAVIDLICTGSESERVTAKKIELIKRELERARVKAGLKASPGIQFVS